MWPSQWDDKMPMGSRVYFPLGLILFILLTSQAGGGWPGAQGHRSQLCASENPCDPVNWGAPAVKPLLTSQKDMDLSTSS